MVNASRHWLHLPALKNAPGFMMNKSLRARARESSRKAEYGFRRGEEDVGNKTTNKEPPLPAALQKKSRRFRRL